MFARPIALTAFLATPVLAQDNKTLEGAGPDLGQTVLASAPDSLVTFFKSAGYPVRLTEDTVGDPLIEYRVNGDKMSLFFYDCEDNVDCQAVQFYAGYTDAGATLETINAWNTDRRFVRAYLTEDNVARIEMDVATSADGLSFGDFEAILGLWLESVDRFEEHIGW